MHMLDNIFLLSPIKTLIMSVIMFSRLGGVVLMVGLDGLRGLFQP